MLQSFRSARACSAAVLLMMGFAAGGTLAPAAVRAAETRAVPVAQAISDSSAPEISSQKERLIRQYLEMTQASAAAAQMMEPLIPVYQEAYPSVPNHVWEKFMSEVASGSLEDFLVPVFAKHLTVAELEAAIAFYETPAGASMLRKMPALMRDSQQAGALWGAQLGEQILQELEKEGYLSEHSASEI